MAHAGHLAEDVASPIVAWGRAVGQGDRGVDRDELAARPIVGPALVSRRGEPAQDAPEAALRLVLDVIGRRADVDLDRALLDEEGRRAVLALAADDLALLNCAPLDRAGCSTAGTAATRPGTPGGSPGSRAGSSRSTSTVLAAGELGLDRLAGASGPGRAVVGAFAAGHAGRAAHRGVEVEGDPSL